MHIIGQDDSRYPHRILPFLGEETPERLWIIGDTSLLARESMALFASVDCPGSIILRAVEFMRDQSGTGTCFVGGFQSPLEMECFRMLQHLEARIILCPARHVAGTRVPSYWRKSIDRGLLLVVSPFDSSERRLTARLAERRNRFVAALADSIMLIHTSDGGKLSILARDASKWGKELLTVEDPRNQRIIDMGARIAGKRERGSEEAELVLT